MFKRNFTLICLVFLFMLVGCGKGREVPEPTVPADLRPIESSVVWDSIIFDSITPVTAFDVTDSELRIYPYNNSDRYITISKILKSRNRYWETAESTYTESGNVLKTDYYSLITLPTSITMGYVDCDDEYAFLVTSDLPSSYVKLVLEELCSAD